MSPGSSGGSSKHKHRAEHVAAPVRVPVARNKGARGSLEQKHRHAVDTRLDSLDVDVRLGGLGDWRNLPPVPDGRQHREHDYDGA